MEHHMTISQRLESHRANLFSAICQIASSEVGPSFEMSLKDQLPSNVLSRSIGFTGIPDFAPHLAHLARKRPRIVGKSVFFGSNSVDFSGSPMTLDLFKTFLESKNHRVTKFDLAKRVYGIKNPRELSPRYWNATKLNITKLVSRARRHAMEGLSPNDESISWFSYNSIADAWELYSIRDKTHPDWRD